MKKILICFMFMLLFFGFNSFQSKAEFDPNATEYYLKLNYYYGFPVPDPAIDYTIDFTVLNGYKPYIISTETGFTLWCYKPSIQQIGFMLDSTSGTYTDNTNNVVKNTWTAGSVKPYISWNYANYKFIDSNIPVFSNGDDALNYFKDGNSDGILNKPADLSTATWKEELDLKSVKWTPHSINWKDVLDDPKAKIEWDYDNEFEHSFMVIESKGQLNCTWYVEVGNKWQIGGNPIEGKATIWDRSDNILASSKSLEYYLELRDRFAAALGISKAYNFVPRYFWVTRYWIDPDTNQVYRSRCYRIKINDDNSIASGEAENGSEDSTSDNWTEDVTDPDFGDGKETIGGVETDNDLPDDTSIDDMDSDDMLSTFINTLKNMKTTLGQFPALVASVFSYLPSYIITFLGLGILIVIILRIIGR